MHCNDDTISVLNGEIDLRVTYDFFRETNSDNLRLQFTTMEFNLTILSEIFRENIFINKGIVN